MVNINIEISDFFLRNKETCLNAQIEGLINELDCCINLVSDKFNNCDTENYDALALSYIYDLQREVKSFKNLLESIK
ncbi:MAG: hypothetical protein ACRCX2_36455 [Paraclostridium sp.]